MKFRMRIVCISHDAEVMPAGDQLHMMPEPYGGWHQLDFADTWCPKSSVETKIEHKYRIETETEED